jgi:Dyp-type peroxidase family
MTSPQAPPSAPALELEDIQGGVLRQRPMPYTGAYFMLHIGDPQQGRTMLSKLLPDVASAANWWDPPAGAWISVALSHQGLAALGVPDKLLAGFAPEFREGMAARAGNLGDTGPSAPENWETPFGTDGVHVAIAVFASDEASLNEKIAIAEQARKELPGITVTFELRTPALPSGRTHLGFVDGIGEPVIEGSGLVSAVQAARGHYGYLPGFGSPVKAGEFLLGHVNELGQVADTPAPDILGRNGTYVSFRKLYVDTAAFRRFLAENSSSTQEEEALAAKIVGRWRSGAPVEVTPDTDDPELAADPHRVNDFLYQADPVGLRCPLGAHIRRMNPRDGLGDSSTDVQLHRILRRGATYGPPLPDGITADDGADRGIVFLFIGADIGRQFEFVKSQWTNDGDFAGLGAERDPVVGAQDDEATFTIPRRPIRRRLHGLPRFVRTCGGEYLFLPSISALTWLAAGRYEIAGG